MSGANIVSRQRKAGKVISQVEWREDSAIDRYEVDVTGYFANSKISLPVVRVLPASEEQKPRLSLAPKTQIDWVKEKNLALMRRISAKWHKSGLFHDPRQS